MKTTIRNVEIKSVAAWLPANKISLLSFCGSFPEKQVRDVIRSSGAEYVYRAEEGQKASDLCFNAAEHLIERDNIDRSSIDGLVFVSSTREWIIPDTAVLLQHRLGLSTETVCQDINYGCTGYIYGLLQASAWINCGMCRNILVLCSEVLTPYLDSHAVGSIETSEVATATLVAQGDSRQRQMCIRDRMIIKNVRMSLKSTPEKFPTNMKEYGNTGCSSIPLLLCDLYGDKQMSQPSRAILCAFGVGLTCGSIATNFSKTHFYAPVNKK